MPTPRRTNYTISFRMREPWFDALRNYGNERVGLENVAMLVHKLLTDAIRSHGIDPHDPFLYRRRPNNKVKANRYHPGQEWKHVTMGVQAELVHAIEVVAYEKFGVSGSRATAVHNILVDLLKSRGFDPYDDLYRSRTIVDAPLIDYDPGNPGPFPTTTSTERTTTP